jgi:hypothetical protein
VAGDAGREHRAVAAAHKRGGAATAYRRQSKPALASAGLAKRLGCADGKGSGIGENNSVAWWQNWRMAALAAWRKSEMKTGEKHIAVT